MSVSNIDETKKFYIDLLGFNVEYERVEDKFALLSFGKGINFQIATDNVSYLATKLKNNKIALFRDIMENQYECNGIVI